MLNLGEDELTQVMGIGYLGEVRQGPDGNLYEWTQGVDGLGNPIGFWRGLRRLGRRVHRFARRAMPIIQKVAPHIPGIGPAAASALRMATPLLRRALPIAQRLAPLVPGGAAALTTAAPILRQAGVEGYDGLGALYQAPDGSLYQVQGFAEEEQRSLGEDDLTQVMGIGEPGEVRAGPDGNLYQWTQGVDGLGNPIGFWKTISRGFKRLRKRVRPFLRKALPIAEKIAPFIPVYGPAVSAGLKVAKPILQATGFTGSEGVGELYQASDGTLYQVEGVSEDEDLRGFSEDEELRGIAEEEELRGFSEDEELRGMGEDEELRGLGQGYVREEGTSGISAFVPEAPAQTRWFVPPSQAPEIFKPLW